MGMAPRLRGVQLIPGAGKKIRDGSSLSVPRSDTGAPR